MKETKQRLLQTAAEMFAEHGIDGVSTRDLAKASGVNLCSINYYFGTKQNLYDAVLEDVIEKITSFAKDKQIPLQSTTLTPVEELSAFICNMVDFLCSDAVSSVEAELLIKEILQPSNAYNKLYKEVIEPMHKRLTGLIMHITGLKEDKAILQTHCLMGQVVMFKIHKTALLRRLNNKEYTKKIIEDIKKQIIANCNLILNGGKQ